MAAGFEPAQIETATARTAKTAMIMRVGPWWSSTVRSSRGSPPGGVNSNSVISWDANRTAAAATHAHGSKRSARLVSAISPAPPSVSSAASATVRLERPGVGAGC